MANKESNTTLENAWVSIVHGLASSGELSPEKLAEKGGDVRVRTLAVHAANLATHFNAEFLRVHGKNLP
jgi:hypothetical protein